ncbi:hypothetical protein [uncultured Roseovarius sp.]|uniref:hypothetical protein n=1 Tax=uncultured Roseovarius sp. TaxID=293344 RepID=UPI002625AC92|nr:hypothetical protein [uncultured Roseovarius sp.]
MFFRFGLTAVTTGILTISASFADEVRLQSLWHEGEGTSRFTGLLALDDFSATAEALIADGFRLIDVETARLNGARGFAGLFVETSGSNYLDVVRSGTALRRAMRSRAADGLRLIDFEVFRQQGERRFAGVFGPGTGAQRLVRPLPVAEFLESKDLMRTLGLRLVDVETIVIGGEHRFAGLYRADAPPTVFTRFRPRANLVELRDRMRSDGWELFDVERAVNAQGADVYFALWRQGNGPGVLSRFRSPAEQLFFASSQEEAGRRALDVELKILVDDDAPPPPPPPPPPEPQLPENSSNITFTDEYRLRIQFTAPDDMPPTIEIPRAWMPDWMPQQDGTYLMPDAACAVNIRNADSIYWQVPGESSLDTETLQSLETVPSEWSLPGVSFAGPIVACAGADVEWSFPAPFTRGGQPFEPLPNLSLVIEAAQGELRFQSGAAPHVEPFDAHELFSDDFEGELMSVLDQFEEVAEEQGNVDTYCSVVGAFWTVMCTVPGAPCPLPRPPLPLCDAG